MTTKPIVIIPARGNSKRLARKNILPWQGIPLIAHTIKNTMASNIFSKVIVSSEDQEILECAVKFGAEPFKRNFGLSKDTSTVVEVCTDVINVSTQPDSWVGMNYDILTVVNLFCAL